MSHNSKPLYRQNKAAAPLPEDIEYVIYVRRSSDETSGNQVQSIATQIQKCVAFAKSSGLTLALKPRNMPPTFETEKDLYKEDNDPEEIDRQIYQSTRKYYIIKESHSAKEPGTRKKRRKLIQLIQNGEIRGVLSYSPDRQSRNMLEGGELIDEVDKGRVDLKYCNFHFENSASGRMMLGIWFVFSKQYSDKLSEDIRSGTARMIEKGKALNNYKYGYIINDKGFYEPHPDFFPLMKKAFNQKLAGVSDKKITEWLKAQGFYRQRQNRGKKKEARIELNEKVIYKAWIDPFYYGKHIHGEYTSNQLEDNEYFKPMITETEYNILYDRHISKIHKQTKSESSGDLSYVTPLPELCITTNDGTALTRTVPNWKKRMLPKLLKLQETNPQANLGDVVTSNQIRYINENKHSKFCKKSLKFDIIENMLIHYLKQFKYNELNHKAYTTYLFEENKNREETLKEERQRLQLQINRHNSEIRKLTDKKIRSSANYNLIEEKQYLSGIAQSEKAIEYLEKEMSKLNEDFRQEMITCEQLLISLEKVHTIYRKCNYVQKKLIAQLLDLNIVWDGEKRLTFTVNPIVSKFFLHDGGHRWTGTIDLFLIREAL